MSHPSPSSSLDYAGQRQAGLPALVPNPQSQSQSEYESESDYYDIGTVSWAPIMTHRPHYW